jgi:hypothetical protein
MLVSLLGLLLFYACSKEEQSNCPDGLVEGRVIGIDARKCACCSGWWIEVGQDTLRAFTLPIELEFEATTLTEGLDIPVCLSYEKATSCTDWEELIEVKEMSLQ